MELDEFKQTWQSMRFSQEDKEMTDLQKMIQTDLGSLLKRASRRYGNVLTSSLIGSVLFVIFFYTISDGFRESPLGLAFGLGLILAVSFVAWRRYQQVTRFDYGGTLRESLNAVMAQSKRNAFEEQALVIGAPILFLIVSRIVNGRGLSGLGQPEFLLGLGVIIGFSAGLVWVIQRQSRQEQAHLSDLINQLG